ncbi:MAG: HAMP domain-containing sensor histidine kinase [Chitinophagaceae bacterium]
MKLFTKYNRINLLATIIVFVLSGIAYFFLLRFILINQVDEDLKIEQHEIENYVSKYRSLPEVIAVKDQQISYVAVNNGNERNVFTNRHADRQRRRAFFRQLDFFIHVKKQWYQVSVSKSLEGTDNLIQSIVTITLVTILVVLVVSLVINRLVLRKLWQPFYDSLAGIRRFELEKKEMPVFAATAIEEFKAMNETFSDVTAKAQQDYLYLKEFTENASHELQTPLAVIKSKLDVLIQDPQLTEAQSKAAFAAYEAIQRLARLNQGLLLLAKIENGQYNSVSDFCVAEKITEKIHQFGELIDAKKIHVHTSFESGATVSMNPALADIMLNNLLSNAIKYNVFDGNINVVVQDGVLEISNSGKKEALGDSKLFRRFAKSGQAEEGIGLGLAIVKQAAEVSGFSARYVYENGLHRFFLIRNPHL